MTFPAVNRLSLGGGGEGGSEYRILGIFFGNSRILGQFFRNSRITGSFLKTFPEMSVTSLSLPTYQLFYIESNQYKSQSQILKFTW